MRGNNMQPNPFSPMDGAPKNIDVMCTRNSLQF